MCSVAYELGSLRPKLLPRARAKAPAYVACASSSRCEITLHKTRTTRIAHRAHARVQRNLIPTIRAGLAEATSEYYEQLLPLRLAGRLHLKS